MATNAKRKIVEEGIVLSKVFKPKTNEFVNSEGKTVPASPDRYIITAVSGEKFDKDTGFEGAQILDYKVEKAIFEKLKALDEVVVAYDFSSYRCTPLSIEPKVRLK